MPSRALRRLIRLLTYAAIRNAWAKVKSPGGAALAIAVVFFFLMAFGPTLFMRLSGQANPAAYLFTTMIPRIDSLLFCATVLIVAMDLGRGLLDLRPAELQFVLAGPFSSSQMLTYRLMNLAINFAWVSLLVWVFMPTESNLVTTFFGIVLSFVFVLAIALIRTLLTPQLTPWWNDVLRVGCLLLLAVVIGEFGWRWSQAIQSSSPDAIDAAFSQSQLAGIASLPFRPFVLLLQPTDLVSAIFNVGIATAMCAAAIAVCYRLNSGFAELAVEGVARRTKRLSNWSQGQFSKADEKPTRVRWRLPMLPRLSGAGVVAWSQLMMTYRRFSKVLVGVFVLSVIGVIVLAAITSAAPNLLPEGQRRFVIPAVMGLVSYIGFILLISARLGFASHSRQLTMYQQLPIGPFPLGIGMIAGLGVFLIVLRLMAFSVAAIASSLALAPSVAILFAFVSIDLAFATSMNFVSAATKYAPVTGSAPDIFLMVRSFIFMFLMGVVFATIALVAFVIAAPVAWWTGASISSLSWSMAFSIAILLPPLWYLSGDLFSKRELDEEA
ncbi:MAG: putative ABC exporter domain-containing protein [Planctomycetota bacterium]